MNAGLVEISVDFRFSLSKLVGEVSMRYLIGIFFILGLFVCEIAHAQQARLSVYVQVSTDDPVGSRMAMRFRNMLADSPFFNPVDFESDAVLSIRMVTIDTDADQQGNATAYSMVFLLTNPNSLPYYYTNFVGICGADRVSSCAERMVSNLLQTRDELLEVANSLR